MSLDNANPTVFQNATGGGRKRFKPYRADNEETSDSDDYDYDSDDDDKAVMSLKDLLKRVTHLDSYGKPEKEVEEKVDYIDAQEVYNLISTISDPEHPLSLGSLAVVNVSDIHLTPSTIHPTKRAIARVVVEITPTVTHCSLATVIGLGIRVRLEQALPPNIRLDVKIKDGTHSQADQVNKQLGDKERVAAALENATLMGVIRKMMETCE